MTWPSQPPYEDFTPKFMHLLFGDGDVVALANLDASGNWSNTSLKLEDAVAHLLLHRDTPNLYFRASANDGSGNYGACNCLRAHALFLDIDYGAEGHKRKSPFKTLDDALGYVLTMPLRPSVAWHTGHGLQCAFLLKEPCVFPAGGGAAEALLLYRAAAEGLANMAMADAAFTPEHAFRVPLTVNSKAFAHPGTDDVRGRVLWLEDWRRYGLGEIEAAVKAYGISDLLDDDASAHHPLPDHEACDYESLPQDLRDEIEISGSERSDRLFGIVGWMVRLGYGDGAIAAAVAHGRDFVEKYGHRQGGLKAEVERCAAKIREGRYVYGGRAKTPVRVYNVPVQMPLGDCAPLTPGFEAMLSDYAKATGARLLQRVYDASRFHEHLHGTRPLGVIESGCGAGKSVWALCHIAMHASKDSRYVYVTETVEALHRAADMLSSLSRVGVGRCHGFNAAKCRDLCGIEHTWRECGRNDSRSACASCGANDRCSYHARALQERQQVLCMTHSGFIRAMEDGSGLLRDANVIIDEGLSPFDTYGAGTGELRRLLTWLNASEHMLGPLFPGTSAAEAAKLTQYGIAGDADVFARRNYIYRDEKQTTALAEQLAVLRALLRKGPGLAGFGAHGDDDPDTARDTLAGLLNFFRPSVRCDASYAYTETKTGGGWQIQCKRSGFSFGAGPWASLWMLNASAQLSPFPYPDLMPVYTCPDLKDNSGLVTLHVLRSNPTKAKRDLTVRLAQVPMAFGEAMRRHKRVLVCADKGSERAAEITEQVQSICGDDAEVTVLARGRIKGVNAAGDCTLALLQGMATFTGIGDCALHACLMCRRTFPDTPNVYTNDGAPNWPGGRMKVPAMRNYYALRSLDEIYQCIWRTAVRNDQRVEAVVVVPDPVWLVALYRTVMPAMAIGSAYREKAGAETFTRSDGAMETWQWDWVSDEELYGMGVCACSAGTEIAKAEVALALGYAGARAWDRHREVIMGMLGGCFGDGRNNRWLRRLGRS